MGNMDECELPEPCPMCGNDRGLTRFSDLNNKLYMRCFRCKHGWHSDTFYNALRRDAFAIHAENERLRKALEEFRDSNNWQFFKDGMGGAGFIWAGEQEPPYDIACNALDEKE